MGLSRRPGSFWKALKHAFAIPQEHELSEQQRQWLERLARKIVERGAATPALFFLECSRPMNYVGAQAFLFFKPLISSLFEPGLCDQVAELLSRRGTVGTLIEMIEGYQAAEGTNHPVSGGEQSSSEA